MAGVAIERCNSYKAGDVCEAVGKALSAVLGSEASSTAGKKVLLKPNLLSAREPARGVTTHPAIVAAAIDYFRDRGALVSVGDSPGGAIRGIRRVWQNTGMLEVCEAKGVPLVNFEASGWTSRCVNGRSYEITKAILDFDRIVNLPKLKTHILVLLTCAVKNMFGCVPGFRKSALHLAHPRPDAMSRAIVDVFSLVRPWVTLVDGIDAMEGNGPSSGSLRHLGLIAAGRDCVALDSALARVVGVDPLRVPTTREASDRGLGEASIERISFFGTGPDEVMVKDFEVPANWRFFLLPGVLGDLLARLVWVKPGVRADTCVGCGDCVTMCPADAIQLSDGRAVIDDERCRRCLCCHEACPAGAIDVRMSRLARLIA